jgi:hypothetical protein
MITQNTLLGVFWAWLGDKRKYTETEKVLENAETVAEKRQKSAAAAERRVRQRKLQRTRRTKSLRNKQWGLIFGGFGRVLVVVLQSDSHGDDSGGGCSFNGFFFINFCDFCNKICT